MRRMMIALLCVAFGAVPVFPAIAHENADLTGRWDLSIKLTGTTLFLTLELRQTGTNLTGTATGNSAVKGTVAGKKLAFTVAAEGITTGIHYVGKVADNETLEGTVDLLSLGSGNWTAKRVKKDQAPQQSPAN